MHPSPEPAGEWGKKKTPKPDYRTSQALVAYSSVSFGMLGFQEAFGLPHMLNSTVTH